MSKKNFTLIFKPSTSGRTEKEVIETLVNRTIEQVLAKNQVKTNYKYIHKG